MTVVASTTEQRALELLGQGVQQAQVASALGVSESYISQLLANESFAARVADIRFEALKKNNARDEEYDGLEDTLLAQLKSSCAFLTKPTEAARVLQIVNAAKRRGQAIVDQGQTNTKIVALVLPVAAAQKFIVSGDNQVLQAGQQQLITIQPEKLKELAEQHNSLRQLNGPEQERVRKTVPNRSFTVDDL